MGAWSKTGRAVLRPLSQRAMCPSASFLAPNILSGQTVCMPWNMTAVRSDAACNGGCLIDSQKNFAQTAAAAATAPGVKGNHSDSIVRLHNPSVHGTAISLLASSRVQGILEHQFPTRICSPTLPRNFSTLRRDPSTSSIIDHEDAKCSCVINDTCGSGASLTTFGPIRSFGVESKRSASETSDHAAADETIRSDQKCESVADLPDISDSAHQNAQSAAAAAGWPQHELWNAPNLVSLVRLASGPLIAHWIISGQTKLALSALLIAGEVRQ